jgi:hypothetical protein
MEFIQMKILNPISLVALQDHGSTRVIQFTPTHLTEESNIAHIVGLQLRHMSATIPAHASPPAPILQIPLTLLRYRKKQTAFEALTQEIHDEAGIDSTSRDCDC